MKDAGLLMGGDAELTRPLVQRRTHAATLRRARFTFDSLFIRLYCLIQAPNNHIFSARSLPSWYASDE